VRSIEDISGDIGRVLAIAHATPAGQKKKGPRRTIEQILGDFAMLTYVRGLERLPDEKRSKTRVWDEAAPAFGYENGETVRERVNRFVQEWRRYEPWQVELVRLFFELQNVVFTTIDLRTLKREPAAEDALWLLKPKVSGNRRLQRQRKGLFGGR
jgi:hypothetical protein